MFGIKPGTWSIRSEKDPRWNTTQREECLSVWCMPDAAEEHLKKCKELYGEQPDDLLYTCMKD